MAMTKVRVIPAMGATIVGPAKLKLSDRQHAVREHILGPHNKAGVYHLDGGKSVNFKAGEEFSMELESGRLNKSLFDFAEPKEAAA